MWKDGIETILDKDGILWLNEKHKEKDLDHKNFLATTLSNHSKHRYELIGEPKKQGNIIFIDKKLATIIIMECRTTSGPKFRTR